MKKRKKKRNAEKKLVQIRKNIKGNVLLLKGGYVPTAINQSEYYENLQKSRVGTGVNKDKRNKLREKAQKRDDLDCAFYFIFFNKFTVLLIFHFILYRNNSKEDFYL